MEDLKGTKYLWLTNRSKWTEKQKKLFKKLKTMDLKVARAWAIKEMFSRLWGYVYEGAARNFFKKWYWWATHCRLKPVANTAKMIKRHLENILTYLKTQDHKCRGGGVKRQNTANKICCQRVQELRELQNGHPILLRETEHVPTQNPVEPRK